MGHQVDTFKRGIYSPFYSKRFFISLVCVRNLQGVFKFHLGVVHTVRNGIKIHAIREKKMPNMNSIERMGFIFIFT